MAVFLFNFVIYLPLSLCLCVLIVCLCIFIVMYMLYSNQPPVQWVSGFSRGKERPGRDADTSPPSSAVVKKE
jgi:hypothetical protein